MKTTRKPLTGKSKTRTPRFSFWRRLKEISLFFQGKDEVHKSLRRLVRRLERAGIAYAVAGGMAVNAHRYRRTTADVDLLLTSKGLEEFKKRFVRKNYLQKEGRARRFIDRINNVEIDFLLAGMYPGSGDPGPIVFPDPEEVAEEIENVQVLNLAALVQLKLAARRHRDFGDVVELIRHNNLDESFAERLDRSVRSDYIECLEEKRREDEYVARNG
jgi:hypothetical protein